MTETRANNRALPRFHALMALPQGMRFAVVGAVSAIFDVGVTGVTFYGLRVHYLVAATLGFCCGVLLNFFGHATVTFPQSTLSWATFGRYLLILAVNYLLTLSIMFALVELLHLVPIVARVITIGLIALNGYFWSKTWIFRGAYER